MIKLNDFPQALVDLLESKFGPVIAVEPLRGVAGSGSSIFKLKCSGGSAVVKSSPSPRERTFYELYAQELRDNGVHIADVYWSGVDSLHHNWIALEDVPGVLAEEQWQNNPMQLRLLSNLHTHRFRRSPSDNEEIWYRPKWDADVTELAFTWFAGTSQRDEVKRLLLNAEAQSQVLFVSNCWLSGDPNPTNWRVRSDGELVMIDWERFCQGNPAIDLAITMPGLGTQDLSLERAIARSYLRVWSDKSDAILPSEAELAAQVRLGKLWTAVEFLANTALGRNQHAPKESIEYITRHLPDFLRMLP